MNLQLEKPRAVLKAGENKKGMNLFLEILVFVIVFEACILVRTLCMIPFEVLIISQNGDYQAAVASGNEEAVAVVTAAIAGSDTYAIASLIATISVTAVAAAFCRVFQKRGPETMGFTGKKPGREYLTGAGVGFAMFSLAILLCVLLGGLRINGISQTFHIGVFLLFVIGYMIQGMGEEVLCRGYLMVSIGRRYPMWVAVLSNAFIFAALHLRNGGMSVLAFLNIALYGIFASLYFLDRGSIWGIGALHSVWNLVQDNFWGLNVSGYVSVNSVFTSMPVEGKNLINGGAFGPEGGIAVTLVLLAGIGFLLWKNDRHTEAASANPNHSTD